MSEAKFTPGPWEVDELIIDGRSYGVKGVRSSEENGIRHKEERYLTHTVAQVNYGGRTSHPEEVANMHFIAAAPDMYEALKAAYHRLSSLDPIGNDPALWYDAAGKPNTVLGAVWEALAKADGKK